MKWKIIPQDNKKNAPIGRYGHFMGVFENKIIVFGGKDKNDESLSDLWVYNLEDNFWTEIEYNNIVTNVPKPKFLVSGCLIENYGYILFFGGKSSEDSHVYILNLYILNEILILKNDNKYSINNLETVAKLNKLWTIKSDTSIF